MIRTHLIPKDTGFSTFYNTHNSEIWSLALRGRSVDMVGEMGMEIQGRLEKLKERAGLDERKVERNYLELEELRVQMEQECQRMLSDREIDSLARGKKENIRKVFEECRTRVVAISQREGEQVAYLKDAFFICEKELQREKEQRGGSMVKLIDQFQAEMLRMQRHLKQIRVSEQEVFEQIEVSIYNMQQTFSTRIQAEQQVRKREHETMIKLVGECIQNFSCII